jgi:hypothetical protein
MHIPDAPGRTELPRQGVRTAVSLVLFIHLFAVSVGIFSNMPPVPDPTQTNLRTKLRQVHFLLAYVQFLNMDRAYNNYYTYGDARDVDHEITVELPGEPGLESIVLPPNGTKPGLRTARYRMLAASLAARAEDDTTEGLIPEAIARHFLPEGARGRARIRCRRHLLLSMEDSRRGIEPDGPGFWQSAYEASVRRSRTTDEIILVKSVNAAETAPVPVPAEGGGASDPSEVLREPAGGPGGRPSP